MCPDVSDPYECYEIRQVAFMTVDSRRTVADDFCPAPELETGSKEASRSLFLDNLVSTR